MFQDFYLAFQDEAEANLVLYTVTPAIVEIDPETGEETVVQEATVKPNYANIDVLGTVYEPRPNDAPEDYEPVPYPAPNYGVNVRVLEGEDPTPLQAYSTNPAPFPQRVWA